MPKNIINANYTHDKRSISRIFNKSYSPDTIHISNPGTYKPRCMHFKPNRNYNIIHVFINLKLIDIN